MAISPKPLDCEPYILTTHPHHAASSFTKFPSLHLNPLTPKSNGRLNSPHHITPESNINVRRIKELIHQLKKLLIVEQILHVSILGDV